MMIRYPNCMGLTLTREDFSFRPNFLQHLKAGIGRIFPFVCSDKDCCIMTQMVPGFDKDAVQHISIPLFTMPPL